MPSPSNSHHDGFVPFHRKTEIEPSQIGTETKTENQNPKPRAFLKRSRTMEQFFKGGSRVKKKGATVG